MAKNSTLLVALAPKARFCPFCASGHHSHCTGLAPAFGGTCECADRGHDPEVRVAAAMRLFFRHDRLGEPVEVLATEYRRSTTR